LALTKISEIESTGFDKHPVEIKTNVVLSIATEVVNENKLIEIHEEKS
jgi:hypothetical protein